SHHIAAISRLDDFALAAACDPEVRRFSILDPEVETYADIEELLSKANVDAVIVASPNRFHVDHGTAVMEARKWLLMEKPLAESADDFQLFAQRRNELGGHC